MTAYEPPVKDYDFLLRNVIATDEVLSAVTAGDVSVDDAMDVVEGASSVVRPIAELSAIGDRIGSRLNDGTIVTPPGFDGEMTARREAEPGFDWPRYPRVLVALDETPPAVFALGHAVPYALDQRSQLTLLAVVPTARFLLAALLAAAGVSPEVMAKQMEKAAADRLRKIAASLPQEISVTTLVRRGDPAEEILAAAREQRADVICLGARGRGRVAGALLGSVSSAVLRGSPVPVVVWHPPPG